MTVVLEASASIELVMNRNKAGEIEKILSNADTVIAPDIYISEIANVFRKYSSLYNLDYEYCSESLETALLIIDDLYKAKDLVNEVFAESYKRRHSVYDLIYAVLARRTGAILLTIDNKLKEICIDMGIRTG